MCVSMAIIAAVTVVTAGVGAASSIASANAQKKAARYERDLRTKQINERSNLERLAAIEAENGRRSEFNAMRSSALAAIGASGLGENITFFQGADPEAQAAFLRDIRNIRLNLAQQESGAADEIQAARYGARITAFNSRQTKIGAVAQFVNTAMKAATMYGQGGAPAPAAAGGGGSSAFKSGNWYTGG